MIKLIHVFIKNTVHLKPGQNRQNRQTDLQSIPTALLDLPGQFRTFENHQIPIKTTTPPPPVIGKTEIRNRDIQKSMEKTTTNTQTNRKS